MPVSLFSRYRNQQPFEVFSSGRGRTRTLPVRRNPIPMTASETSNHQFASYETADLLALKYFAREELFWALLDANEGRLPDDFVPGETLNVPSVRNITRIQLPGR